MQTYTVKLLKANDMEKLPQHLRGWWTSQPGAKIKMQPATDEDLAAVYLGSSASRDPADYLREVNGKWVVHKAAIAEIRA